MFNENTLLIIQQPRGYVKLNSNPNSERLFYELFSYFYDVDFLEFSYLLNILSEPKNKVLGCSLAVWSEHPSYSEPQYLSLFYKEQEFQALYDFLNLPKFLFQKSEIDILIFYDRISHESELTEITETWRQTIQP